MRRVAHSRGYSSSLRSHNISLHSSPLGLLTHCVRQAIARPRFDSFLAGKTVKTQKLRLLGLTVLCANEKSRTSTGLLPLPPQGSASTNSATSAFGTRILYPSQSKNPPEGGFLKSKLLSRLFSLFFFLCFGSSFGWCICCFCNFFNNFVHHLVGWNLKFFVSKEYCK
jgi:hypothetical protein